MKRTKFKKRSISVGARKAKGRELQKWVCAKISELTGQPWGPDTEIESRPMGQRGVDARLGPSIRRIFPYSLECKRQETWSVPSWIEQAKKNQMPGTDWLLVMRRNRGDPVAVLDATAFFMLLERLKQCGGSS